MSVLCCVPFHELCRLTKYTIVDTALVPTLTVDMPSVGPGDSQALFSPGHWLRSMEVRSQDCTNCVPGSPLGAVEQLRLWPDPTPESTCPQSPQLLKPDQSQLQEQFCPFGCSTGSEFRKPSAEM